MSHPARDAWILASCIFLRFFQYLSHPARDAWILAVYRDYNKYNDLVASYMGCVASSMVAQIYFC